MKFNKILFKIGDIVKHYKILDYDLTGKETLYKCQCVNCNTIVLRNSSALRSEVRSRCSICRKLKFIQEPIGKKYGCLTVIEKVGDCKQTSGQKYKCRCDCGNEFTMVRKTIMFTQHLCCKKCRADYFKGLDKFKKHGMVHTPIYNIWLAINARCLNKSNHAYKDYGARGILICEDWIKTNPSGFMNFYKWAMDNGYKHEVLPNGKNKWTLDRIDNNGNYEPNNCRFTTMQEQANNKRNNLRFEYNNQTHSLADWVRILNLDYNRVKLRLDKGYSFEYSINDANFPKWKNKIF